MSLSSYPVKMQPENLVGNLSRILGTGADDPTVEVADGVTVAYVSTGLYRYTFADHLGDFMDAFPTVSSSAPDETTPRLAQVDHTSYSASARTLDVYVTTPATEAVAAALSDLESTDKLSLLAFFQQ